MTKKIQGALRVKAIHPGEILMEEFLRPLKISQYRLAKDIGVSPRRINEIVLQKRIISANTALRLSKYFKTSPEFWLNLQSHYDLEIETEKLSDTLKDKVKIFKLNANTC
jgi:addiction module HigA family antidote